MKTSQEALELYKKLDSLWEDNGVTPANKIRKQSRTIDGEVNPRYESSLEKVDFATAKKFFFNAMRMAMGNELYNRRLKGKPIEEVGGSSNSWAVFVGGANPFNKRNYNGHFRLNTDFGWAEMIHDLGHYIHAVKNPDIRPHCAEHAVIELRLTKYCIEKGYVETSNRLVQEEKDLQDALKDQVKVVNQVAENYKAAKSRLANNERLLRKYTSAVKSAERRIARDQKKIAKYERDYSSERLAAKYVLKAKTQSYKQKCMSLVEEIEWLNIERDDFYTWKTVIDVLDNRKEYDWDRDSEDREWTLDSWKSAYEYACELVQEEKS